MNQKQKIVLRAEDILKYLIGKDDKLDTLILCHSSHIDLVTSDLNLYEALGSIKPYDDFKLNKLTKLLEVVSVVSQKKELKKEKKILKHERVEELRNVALK